MKRDDLILWESPRGRPVAARVAVAGDFLPAGKLAISAASRWGEMASPLADHFGDVAATFANLESTLDAEGLMARRLCGIGEIVAAPRTALEYLGAIHSRGVGIANNHSYDFGPAGVERTRDAISEFGMAPLGAGRTLKDPPGIHVWQGPGDIRIGFWAAAAATHDQATRQSPGVEPASVGRAAEALETMKRLGARFSIALLHAGCLRTNRPDREQVALMDSIAKRGFDVVASSHSHRISGAKMIAGRKDTPSFCFYGLGSLVSGYAASAPEREGLIVAAGFDSDGYLVRIEVRPVLLGGAGFGEIPSPEMGRTILARFVQLCGEIAEGSYERLFYEDVSRGLLRLYLRDMRAAFRESGIRGLAEKVSHARMRHAQRLFHRVIPS
ncbi:MAG: CapA family protein [Candidatus Acidiferrales bacterium]